MTDKPITSAELLTMRAQAADAENAAITCTRNMDRLTRAYAALEIEVVKLRAELDEARKDAERYRRLKKSSLYVGPEYESDEAGGISGYENHNSNGCILDAAIDAMKEQQS